MQSHSLKLPYKILLASYNSSRWMRPAVISQICQHVVNFPACFHKLSISRTIKRRAINHCDSVKIFIKVHKFCFSDLPQDILSISLLFYWDKCLWLLVWLPLIVFSSWETIVSTWKLSKFVLLMMRENGALIKLMFKWISRKLREKNKKRIKQQQTKKRLFVWNSMPLFFEFK